MGPEAKSKEIAYWNAIYEPNLDELPKPVSGSDYQWGYTGIHHQSVTYLQKTHLPRNPQVPKISLSKFFLRLSFRGCNSNGPDSQFRLRGGTQALPLKLAERLTKRHGKSQVLLRHEVTKVSTMEVGMGREMVLLMEKIGWENHHLGLVAHPILSTGF